MELRIKHDGGIYRLEECAESESAPFGVVFVCESAPSPSRRKFLEGLNSMLLLETTAQCGEPWKPDAASVAHGMCEAMPGVEILGYKGWEYPADAVF